MRPPRNARAAGLPVAAVILASLAACGPGDAAGTAAGAAVERVVVDGVEVVRNLGGGGPPAELVEELRLGSLDGAEHEVFGGVFALVPLADGAVAVLDRQIPRVHVYDREGRHLHSFGARGEGPGEFEDVTGFTTTPDGLLALHDARLGRLSFFDLGGRFLHTRAAPGGLFGPNLLQPAPGGVMLRINLREPGAPPGAFTPALVRFGADPTGPADTLPVPAPAVDPAHTLVASQGGRTSSRNVPFTPQSTWTWHPDGGWVTGTGEAYRMDFLDEGGRPVRVVERDVPPVPVHRDEAAELRLLAEAAMREVQPDWRWTGADVPSHKPYFAALTVGLDASVWVLRSAEGVQRPLTPEAAELPLSRRPSSWVAPLVYDVFAADGRFLGEVRPPSGFSLLAATAERVWSREADALGVPQVVRYRVVFPDPDGG